MRRVCHWRGERHSCHREENVLWCVAGEERGVHVAGENRKGARVCMLQEAGEEHVFHKVLTAGKEEQAMGLLQRVQKIGVSAECCEERRLHLL